MLEFRILGPLQVLRAGREVSLGGRKQRAVLALLLLEAGRVVQTDRLIEDLWQGRPPPSAEVTLRSYISRLRVLRHPDVGVIARGGGYVLESDAFDLDAGRFQELVREGEDALARGLVKRAAERFRSGEDSSLASGSRMSPSSPTRWCPAPAAHARSSSGGSLRPLWAADPRIEPDASEERRGV
jgi:DNA-binding SARP family transcriptional activator